MNVENVGNVGNVEDIGTGLFALTGLVASKYAGPAIILSYTIAGFVCIFVALIYTELSTMLPTSGSIYTYSYVAFGEVSVLFQFMVQCCIGTII